MTIFSKRASFLSLLLILAGCTNSASSTSETEGLEGDSGSDPDSDSNESADGTESGVGDDTEGEGSDDGDGEEEECRLIESRLVRLSPTQYDNTVLRFIPKSENASEGYLPTFSSPGLLSHSQGALTLSTPHISQLLQVANSLSEKLLNKPQLVDSCIKNNVDDPECRKSFVLKLLDYAFRRTPTQEEVDDYLSFMEQQMDLYGEEAAVTQIVSRALMSPNFLFRSEIGNDLGDGTRELGPNEIADQLSYLLTDAPPDELLRSVAEFGDLSSDDSRRVQAKRLLATAESAEGLRHFMREHTGSDHAFDLIKDDEVFKDFAFQKEHKIKQAFSDEVRHFVDHVLWSDDAKISTLLTAPYTFINKNNATIYGLNAGDYEDNVFVKYDFQTEQRAGFLTQPALMAHLAGQVETSIVDRGLHINEAIICRDISPPPPGVADAVPEFDETMPLSQRERLEMHKTDPSCAICHTMIDPPGYVFEHFDAIGKWREDENGLEIDQTGELPPYTNYVGGPLDGIPLAGPVELAHALADYPPVQHCFSERMYSYSYGRNIESDRCAIDAINEAMTQDDGSIFTAIIELVSAEHFVLRLPTDEDPNN